MNKYVIIYYKRSGSTYIRSILQNESYKSIIFSKNLSDMDDDKCDTNNHKISSQKINRIINKHLDFNFVGFKIPYQETSDELFDYLINENFKILLINRENVFEQYVSQLISARTNVWNIYVDDNDVDNYVRRNEKEFLIHGLNTCYIEKINEKRKLIWDHYIKNDTENYSYKHTFKVKCKYEDVFNFFKYMDEIRLRMHRFFNDTGLWCWYPNFIDNIEELHRMCDYLNFDFEKLSKNTTIKLEKMKMNERVENYYELKTAFEGTVYHKHFDC